MNPALSRRALLKGSTAAAAMATMARFSALSYGNIVGSNEAIRIGVVGFNGRGVTHIEAWSNIRGVRLVALCDADSQVLDKTADKVTRGDFIRKAHPTTAPATGAQAKGAPATQASALPATQPAGPRVDKYVDVRKLLDDKNIDAISIATPNHWHALMTVWGCQAGKDVYVEKPVSHEVSEGRKAVEAARKYNRIVQAGTQSRSSLPLKEAIEWIRAGNIGKIEVAHGLCFKRRGSIGKVASTPAIPPSVNLDLWCGPAPLQAPHRKQFHYDWHWFWDTGNGDIGNQGIHQMDVCRWALGKKELSSRVLSVGGRFGYDDDGQTPNTQIAIHDYGDSLLIFEVRGLPKKPGSPKMDTLEGQSVKHVVYCEDGYLSDTIAYDNDHKEIRNFRGKDSRDAEEAFEGDHFKNFIDAVRTRKVSDLHADIEEGHLSSALCHISNISHRLGEKADPDAIRAAFKNDVPSLETFERFRKHLARNEVDISIDKATLGPALKLDPKAERFVDNEKANALLRRTYREPFVLPEEV